MTNKYSLEDVTTLIVNYKTLRLTRICVESFLDFYPSAKMLLIDNGSFDASTVYIEHMASRYENVNQILYQKNIYHGPALDQGIRAAQTGYVFTLDSDCEVVRGGFLEEMLHQFENPLLYATGNLTYKNRHGFNCKKEDKRAIKYINPHAMMIETYKYQMLSPFFHHGAPCIKNMSDAERKGFLVENFPIEPYIRHEGRGTCSKYGYGLGPRTFLLGIYYKNISNKIIRLPKSGFLGKRK